MTTLRRALHPLALAALIAAGCGDTETDPTLRVPGHVEATEVQVAAEVGGRLLDLAVKEGDRVEAGQLLVRLDTRDTELQMRRAQAERAAAVAQLRLLQAGSRDEDIRQADAQAKAAAAEVAAVAADLDAAMLDLDRFEALLAANAGSRKQRDDARARVAVLRERQRAAEDRLAAARETVTRLRAGARPEEIEAARARVAAAEAQLAVLEDALADAVVKAPVSGIVTQTVVEAGELVRPGTPLLVLTDLDNAWANLFVPGPMVPRLRLGQEARVTTDAGGEAIPGRITFISPNAEFTPRNVQTAEERSKLVYRIKVSVDNREGILKPGMPVDAQIEPAMGPADGE